MKNKAIAAFAAGCSWCRILRSHSGARRTMLRILLAFALLQALNAHAQPPPVLQRGYDANVSGATLSETTLKTSNVIPGTFGLVFKLSVDDNIMAQPLFVPNVVINGASHNVVYVATMSDTLYAFDADVGGAPLWTFNLATFENAVPVPIAQFQYSDNKNIINNLGILSTPVIDYSTNTLYAVACTMENGTLVYRLHAVDITNGTPRTSSGVQIAASSGSLNFNARNQYQRVSLVLSGNNVVFAFGALELESTAHPYAGWVMAYDKGSLMQTGSYATVTTGNGGGGVWQSGRPPAVDGSGNVYVLTGNAYGNGFDGIHNFSESILKLNPATALSRVDYFTPSNWSSMDVNDLDLTSSGAMLVSTTGNTTLLVGGGKTGVLYVLNTGNLGQNSAGDSGAVQEIQIAASELRGGPVYWNRSAANGGPLLYDWGVNDALKSFAFNGTTFATSPSATGTVGSQNWPGGILTLSANADTAGSGVIWATVATSGDAENNPPVPGALYAFDAGNVAAPVLWNSNMNAARDSFGNFAKFVPPLVANGRVYVATWSQQVAVYGLILPAPVLTGVAPTSGSTAGGTPVRLSGQNFVAKAAVTFGGAAATAVTVVSATQINANTPAHAAGSVDVVVTNPDGQSATVANGFTYLAPAPTLSGISPTTGSTAGGTPVTLTGTNFVSGATVTIGGAAATAVTVVSATQITATTPAHAAGSVNVVVTNPDGQGVTLTNGFTFVAAGPTISGVSPTTGLTGGGTQVMLTGTNFVSGATVSFGGTAATSVTFVSGTQINATAPPHKPGAVNIVVSNPNGQEATLAAGFTYHKH